MTTNATFPPDQRSWSVFLIHGGPLSPQRRVPSPAGPRLYSVQGDAADTVEAMSLNQAYVVARALRDHTGAGTRVYRGETLIAQYPAEGGSVGDLSVPRLR